MATTDDTRHLAETVGLGQAYVSKIFAAVEPGAVFGAPVVMGEYAVITASEVVAGGGSGSGWGSGDRGTPPHGASGGQDQGGSGGGNGGGGGAHARPVAAIVVGPNGVAVRPIFDVTKLAIAGLTAVGAVAAAYLLLRAKAR